MAEPARRQPMLRSATADGRSSDGVQTSSDDANPSLDPRAIEQAYRRERARRRAKVERRAAARHSNLRFWGVLLLLTFITAFALLLAWREVQTLFGV